MSFEAFVWAWRQPVTNPTDQHVLLALANIAPIRETFASATYIGEITRRSERHVRRSLVSLEAGAFITITERPGRTDLIRLNIPADFTVSMPPEGDLEKGKRGRPRKPKTPDIGAENPGHEIVKPPPLVSDEPLEEPKKEPKELVLREPDPFETWWAVYPLKVAKVAARKAWAKATPAISALTLTELMERTRRFAEAMVNRDPEHIAHPATWLNGERWNDQLPTPRSQTDGQSRQPAGRTGPVDFAAERSEARARDMLAGAAQALDGGGRRRWRI